MNFGNFVFINLKHQKMKATLITGASGGIGAAFAERLAKEKHNLFLVARSEDKLKKMCEDLSTDYKITAQYLAIDLSKSGNRRNYF